MTEGLPVIERPLDNTALSAYMACPREFLFGMIMHRRSAGSSAALTFGSAWHHTLERLYKGDSDMQAIDYALSRWEQKPAPDEYRTPQRLILDLKKYLKRWPLEKDRKQTVGWPDEPLVELRANAMTPEIIHPYAGKLDRFFDDGLLLGEDHKTTSRLDKNTFLQYQGSNQMKGYTFLGNALMPDRNITGVRINLIHTTKTKTDFHRELVTYTPQQLREWASNYNSWVRRIAKDLLAWHTKLLNENPRHVLPRNYEDDIEGLVADCGFEMAEILFHEQDMFPAHFGDNGCSRKYGLCQYFHVCKLNPANHMRVLEHDYELNEWNPLEDEDNED